MNKKNKPFEFLVNSNLTFRFKSKDIEVDASLFGFFNPNGKDDNGKPLVSPIVSKVVVNKSSTNDELTKAGLAYFVKKNPTALTEFVVKEIRLFGVICKRTYNQNERKGSNKIGGL